MDPAAMGVYEAPQPMMAQYGTMPPPLPQPGYAYYGEPYDVWHAAPQQHPAPPATAPPPAPLVQHVEEEVAGETSVKSKASIDRLSQLTDAFKQDYLQGATQMFMSRIKRKQEETREHIRQLDEWIARSKREHDDVMQRLKQEHANQLKQLKLQQERELQLKQEQYERTVADWARQKELLSEDSRKAEVASHAFVSKVREALAQGMLPDAKQLESTVLRSSASSSRGKLPPAPAAPPSQQQSVPPQVHHPQQNGSVSMDPVTVFKEKAREKLELPEAVAASMRASDFVRMLDARKLVLGDDAFIAMGTGWIESYPEVKTYFMQRGVAKPVAAPQQSFTVTGKRAGQDPLPSKTQKITETSKPSATHNNNNHFFDSMFGPFDEKTSSAGGKGSTAFWDSWPATPSAGVVDVDKFLQKQARTQKPQQHGGEEEDEDHVEGEQDEDDQKPDRDEDEEDSEPLAGEAAPAPPPKTHRKKQKHGKKKKKKKSL